MSNRRRGTKRRSPPGATSRPPLDFSRNVTIKEIAAIAGVSQSTVSRVLNSANFVVPIAEKTRARVLEVAKEAGYRPNPLARGLRGATTGLLGLIVREIVDPFFAAMIEAITKEARRNGYNVVLGYAQSSAHEALQLKTVLETRHCDAIIILGDVKEELGHIAHLASRNRPVVALCQGSRLPEIPTVNCDNRLGATMALEYLYTLGHRRIAFIDAGWLGDIQERRVAYFQFMQEHALPVHDGLHQLTSNDPAGGSAAFQSLQRVPTPPTAIFASTDAIAIGILKAAALAAIKIPDRLSVIGFDDIAFAGFVVPSLTTVRQPVQEMGHLAVQQVLQLLRDPKTSPEHLRLVKPELVVRDSCSVASAPMPSV